MSQDFLLRIANRVFQLSVTLLLLSGAAVLVFGNPNAVKKAAHDSRIYDAAAVIVQDQAINIDIAPAIKPALESAATSSFTSPYLQSSGEQVIDGSYHWLNGKAAKPDFEIDATAVIGQFMNAVSDEAVKYAQQLPACKPGGLSMANLATSDLLTLQCLPPGTTSATVRDVTIERLQDANNLLKNPIITVDSVTQATHSQNLLSKFSNLPSEFRTMMLLPILFGTAAGLAAAFVFVLYNNAAKSVFGLAKSLLWASLPILLFGIVAHMAFNVLTQPGGSITKSVDGTYQQYGVDFIRSLESTFARTVLVLSAGTAIVGGIIAGVLRMRLRTADEIHGLELAKSKGKHAEPTLSSTATKKSRLTAMPAAPVGSTVVPDPVDPDEQALHMPPQEIDENGVHKPPASVEPVDDDSHNDDEDKQSEESKQSDE